MKKNKAFVWIFAIILSVGLVTAVTPTYVTNLSAGWLANSTSDIKGNINLVGYNGASILNITACGPYGSCKNFTKIAGAAAPDLFNGTYSAGMLPSGASPVTMMCRATSPSITGGTTNQYAFGYGTTTGFGGIGSGSIAYIVGYAAGDRTGPASSWYAFTSWDWFWIQQDSSGNQFIIRNNTEIGLTDGAITLNIPTSGYFVLGASYNRVGDPNDNDYKGLLGNCYVWNYNLTSGERNAIMGNESIGLYGDKNWTLPTLSISFVGDTPVNNTAQYYTQDSFTINTTSVGFGGTINTSHYVYNSTLSLIQFYSNLSARFTTNVTGLTVGTYYYAAIVNNGTHNASTGNNTIYIYNLTSGSITSPSYQANLTNSVITLTTTNITPIPAASGVTSTNFNFSIWNDNGIIKTLFSGTNTTNEWNISSENLGMNNYTLTVVTTDSNGINTTTYTQLNLIAPKINNPGQMIQGGSYLFTLNLTNTLTYSFSSVVGNLSINGTAYTATTSNDGYSYLLSVNYSAQNLSATTTFVYNWTFSINGNSYLSNNSQVNQLALTPLTIVNTTCGALQPAMFFNFKDEQNFTAMNASISYNFNSGVFNGSSQTTFGSMTLVSNFSICINSTLYPNWTIGNGEIYYTSPGYVDRRYYIFQNTRVTNNTVNITLYNLLSSEQTSFSLTIQSNSLASYEDKYTTLVRWYPGINSYNVVDMGNTDQNGQTVIHVEVEDVDYRIGVYELDGTLIYLADPIRMICLTTPCSYTLNVAGDTAGYNNLLNIQYNLTFNSTTGIWTLVYNDPSQTTTNINLTVYKDTGVARLTICNNNLTAYTGVISCNTSGYTGTLRAIAARSASPETPFASLIADVGSFAFKSTWGLFMVFFVVAAVIFIFAIISPIAAVIGAVIALIPAWYFGTIATPIILGFAVLGGIIIHFMNKR